MGAARFGWLKITSKLFGQFSFITKVEKRSKLDNFQRAIPFEKNYFLFAFNSAMINAKGKPKNNINSTYPLVDTPPDPSPTSPITTRNNPANSDSIPNTHLSTFISFQEFLSFKVAYLTRS